jgi:hypothetical protein
MKELWKNIKWIISSKLLWWGACLVPKGTPEKKEIMLFLHDYATKCVARRR